MTIANRGDLHEYIRKAVGVSGQNVDGEYEPSDLPGFLSALYGLSCASESIADRQIPVPSFLNKDRKIIDSAYFSSVFDYTRVLSADLLVSQISSDLTLASLLEWSVLTKKSSAKAVSSVKRKLSALSGGVTGRSIRDTFASSFLTSGLETTAKRDPILNAYTNKETAAIKKLTIDDIDFSFSSTLFSIESRIQTSQSGDSTYDSLLSGVVTVAREEDVVTMSLTLKSDRTSLNNYSDLRIETNMNRQGAETIFVTIEVNGKLYQDSFAVDGEVLHYRYRDSETVESLTIEVVSNRPDSFANGQYSHTLLIDSIFLSSSENTDDKKVQSLEFDVSKEAPTAAFFSFESNNDSLVEMSARAFNAKTNKWIELHNLKNRESRSLFPLVPFSNSGLRETEVLSSYPSFYTDTFLSPRFSLSDCSLASGQGAGQWRVNPRSCVVYRDVATEVLHVSPLSSSLNDTELDGWMFEEGVYKTTLTVTQSSEVDFGSEDIVVSGEVVNGVYKFSPGDYKIGIFENNWTTLKRGLSDSEHKSYDKSYPHNHKYLIQGYDASSTYSALGFISKGRARFVDLALISSGMYRHTDSNLMFYSMIEEEENGVPAVRFVFPFDQGNCQIERERVKISGSYYEWDDAPSKMSVSFVLKGGAILDSYEVIV